MKLDKNALDALLNMSDDDFANKIGMIASALGVPPQNVSADRVRSMLRGMSENDLYQLINSLGSEKTAELMKIIGGK